MNRVDAAPLGVVTGFVQIRADPEWRLATDLAASIGIVDGVRWRCAVPGLHVTWSAKNARHAARDGSLCIVWGSPRYAPSPASGIAGPASAEQILERLVAAGAAALGDIRGGFGLVFLDTEARRLVLAVDRFSVETLCYAIDDDGLAFSDRADEVPLETTTISPQSLYDYLYFHCIPAPATVFREVRRIDCGSHVCFEKGERRDDRHWRPRFEPSRQTPFTTLCNEFRTLVRDAVAVEAGRGEKLGCFLSGGTDSSTIAGMLCAVTGEPARTYSIGFEARGYDEMEYARVAAKHFGTEHHEYYVTADDVASSIPDIAAYVDQPFGNSSLAPSYFCARMARADGVTRMLAGDGGDELFGGNARYRLQLLFDLYAGLPAALRERLIEPALVGNAVAARIPGLKQAAGYVRHARIPMPDRLETFNLLRRVGGARILDAEWLAAMDTAAPLRAQRETYSDTPATHVVDRMLHYDWKYTLADSDLPKVRAAIGLTGITVGYPLLTDEIADFSLRLPHEYKVRKFALRWFFKEALRGFLPDAIIRKKKHGFGLPFGLWAVRHAGLRELAADALAALERRSILRRGFRDDLMDRLLPAHPGYYGELVWILMMLELWLAAHRDVRPLPPSPSGAGQDIVVATVRS